MSQMELTSIPADELLQGESTIPNEATKYAQDGSEQSEPLPNMISRSNPWKHKPGDLKIRDTVASCNAVRFLPNAVECCMTYQSQVLSARQILSFARLCKRPLPNLILSLQVVDMGVGAGETTTSPKEFKTILSQAHKRKQRLRVYWKDRTMGLDEVIAEDHISLVLSFMWREKYFITQFLPRWPYILLASCFLVFLLGTCFLILFGTCINFLVYFGTI
jgi:hypothetical protein